MTYLKIEPKQKPITNSKSMDRLLRNDSTRSLFRDELIKSLLDPRIDLYKECGYPENIRSADYNQMYEREGVARRIVHCLPEESWAMEPSLYETEDQDDVTPFEKGFTLLCKRFNLWGELEHADVQSGIGRFGIILLGIDDGKELSEPVDRFDPDRGPSSVKRKLVYTRVFNESVITISESEKDKRNPRYGQPVVYRINYYDESTNSSLSATVHWHRIVHIIDNRSMSMIYGTPRMKPVYNRLMDIRKILSGSGEMFWKGGFPGFSFEVSPDQRDATIDAEAMRAEFLNYSNGLQRYLALSGVSAKTLAPQVSDPGNHINAQMEHIAITLGIPKRVLFGSEQSQLASSQDIRTWNKRLRRRQTNHITPDIISALVDRLIYLGCIPSPKEIDESGSPVYIVDWPDLNTITDQEKAELGVKRTEALAKYVAGGIENIIPRLEYYTKILGMGDEEARALVDAGDELMAELNVDENGDMSVPPDNSGNPDESAEEVFPEVDEDGNEIPVYEETQ